MISEFSEVRPATNNLLAVVLAGGRGTRLGELSETVAKPAVAFGGSYRLIDFTLSNCLHSGVHRIAVVTQFRARQLHRHLKDSWNFLSRERGEFLEAWPAEQCARDGGWYKGTADAIYRNLEAIDALALDHVLVLAGDHIYKQDYGRMLADHISADADVTVSAIEVPLRDASHFGVLETNESGLITAFHEKPAMPPQLPGRPGYALASMGIYIFRRDFLRHILLEDKFNDTSSHDFGHDILPKLVGRAKIVAHSFARSCISQNGQAGPYWRDVGTIDAYFQAHMDLLEAAPVFDPAHGKWPILGTSLKGRAQTTFQKSTTVEQSIVGHGCQIVGGSIRRSVLSDGTVTGDQSELEQCVVLPRARVGAHAKLRRVIVSEGCVVPDNFHAGFDPDEDFRWFNASPDGVILITEAGLERRNTGLKLRAQGKPPVAAFGPWRPPAPTSTEEGDRPWLPYSMNRSKNAAI